MRNGERLSLEKPPIGGDLSALLFLGFDGFSLPSGVRSMPSPETSSMLDYP
jgi:hypothetical protein